MTTLAVACLALGYTWLLGCVLLATGCAVLAVITIILRRYAL